MGARRDAGEWMRLYESCELCPNHCKVNRLDGHVGACLSGAVPRISFCGLHRGEEPPVSGERGSGMLFFNGCPLHCRYCQNFQISESGIDSPGISVTPAEMADLMLGLQAIGAASINLVTSSHFLPSVVMALDIAKGRGLTLPVVYNTSGYEDVQALELIDRYIDLYLIDVKTLSRDVARVFCGKADYPDVIVPVMEFLRERHPRTFRRRGRLYGVLVRHLVFPGTLKETMEFLRWYADGYKDMSYLSLMVQFVPPKVFSAAERQSLEPLSRGQYDSLMEALEMLGIENGFYQEFGEDGGFERERMWIPDFTKDQPFAPGFAEPLELFLEMKKERGG